MRLVDFFLDRINRINRIYKIMNSRNVVEKYDGVEVMDAFAGVDERYREVVREWMAEVGARVGRMAVNHNPDLPADMGCGWWILRWCETVGGLVGKSYRYEMSVCGRDVSGLIAVNNCGVVLHFIGGSWRSVEPLAQVKGERGKGKVDDAVDADGASVFAREHFEELVRRGAGAGDVKVTRVTSAVNFGELVGASKNVLRALGRLRGLMDREEEDAMAGLQEVLSPLMVVDYSSNNLS